MINKYENINELFLHLQFEIKEILSIKNRISNIHIDLL